MKAINRLYEYLDYKDIKPTRFEKEAGLSNGYLGTQFKREADLGESILNKIIDYCLDLNTEWLLTGKGSMLKGTAEYIPTKEEVNTVSEPQPPVYDSFKEKYYRKLEEENEMLKKTLVEKDELIDMYKSGKIIIVENKEVPKKGVLK